MVSQALAQIFVSLGLIFPSQSFDYVHQRDLSPGLPILAYDKLLRDIYRILKPGGMFEMMEQSFFLEPEGLGENGLKLRSVIGEALKLLETDCIEEVALNNNLQEPNDVKNKGVLSTPSAFPAKYVHKKLQDIGFCNIEAREFNLKVGQWGGRLGEMVWQDIVSIVNVMVELIVGSVDIQRDTLKEIIDGWIREGSDPNNHMTMKIFVFVATK